MPMVLPTYKIEVWDSSASALGQGHFWPQGQNLNKLCIDPLGDAAYQISRL